MTRTCAFLVLMLAGAPTETLFCLSSCAAGTETMPAAATCQSTTPQTPDIAARDLDSAPAKEDEVFAGDNRRAPTPQASSRGAPVRNRSPVLRI